MGLQPYIYGIDIETDTRVHGFDPAVAPITTVALSGRTFEELFLGDEADLLGALDRRLASLPPGLIATWNGATFDLPFIADRAQLLGVPLHLRLCLDRSLTMGRSPLPGHAGAYRAAWGDHAHLDTYRIYGETSTGWPVPGWSSLRTIGRLIGLNQRAGHLPRQPDLATEALHANAASDARLARALAERRWAAGLRLADQVSPEETQQVAVAVRRVARQGRFEPMPVRTALG